jgi:hypothetical protein
MHPVLAQGNNEYGVVLRVTRQIRSRLPKGIGTVVVTEPRCSSEVNNTNRRARNSSSGSTPDLPPDSTDFAATARSTEAVP